MKHVKLLDCTLRDGAYLLNKNFGENNILGIISGLVKAKIDIIEVGFFQDTETGTGKTVYKNSKEVKKYIPKDKNGCLFTVLSDYSRYTLDNLDNCDPKSIDGIRECFKKDERFKALENCKKIKEKGYKLFVQPVDILGYTDEELLDLIKLVNEIEPYCFSIVDTFGSMYQEDLHRIFEIINHNLVSTCRIGFHSHNNMQLSNSLSQEFARMTFGKRDVIIDGTISGMGRGAGNTPTELIAQYLNTKWEYNYDMDSLLDIIDDYMDNIRTKCNWGYNTEYFIAGAYGCHVDNIQYLANKSSIHSKDMRYILNQVGSIARKKAIHNLLEETYLKYMSSDIDDAKTIKRLQQELQGKDILILSPGYSIKEEHKKIQNFINQYRPTIISISFIPENINIDYVYISNTRRYSSLEKLESYNKNKIITSNIKNKATSDNEYIVSFSRLVKCGWEHLDNSTILLMRLLDLLNVKSINIAGFDGYDIGKENYATKDLELLKVKEDFKIINEDTAKMLRDYMETRKHKEPITLITKSRFSSCLKNK